jgi:N-acetylmuramoyl-L-alanine amidase
MPAFFYYLVKVLVCSGLFYAYYYFALRNKKINHFNRYYLLSAATLSWIIPLLKIDFFDRHLVQPPPVVKILQVVAGGGNFFSEEDPAATQAQWDWTTSIAVLFLLISLFFFVRTLLSLLRIAWLIHVSPREQRGKACLVYSNAKGTPFSFFRYIFWNKDIRLDSPEGQRVFRHEWAHSRGRHSLDRLFLHGCLVVGWYNPFVWLILRELNMVHEFLADQESVEEGDVSSLAVLLLTSAFPGMQPSDLVHGFFHSPVERRVGMLVQRRPGLSFIRRWGILPLIPVMLFFFAFRVKEDPSGSVLARQYTVILDAGHGGSNSGAVSNFLVEKDVNLRIAQKVKTLNTDADLHLLLTRTGDEDWSPRERVDYTAAQKADLFISIHTNSAAKKGVLSGGADICLSGKEGPYARGSRLFASYLADQLKDLFKGEIRVVQKMEGVTVLGANRSCPAVLVECGYLGEVAGADKETIVARRILEAVDQYFGAMK